MTNKNRLAAFLYLSLICGLVFVLGLVLSPLIKAATSDISKSYNSLEAIPGGSLVSLKFNSKNEVVLANTNSSNKLIGVAVESDKSLIAVNKNSGNTMVSISGQANTFVSTINGDIIAGDLIAESLISGVGAKAVSGDKVVGVAQKDFKFEDQQKTSIKNIQLGDKELTVAVGSIPILIALSTTNTQKKLSPIEEFAINIAGKPVSILRLVLSAVIGLMVVVALGVMVFSSIKSSITAVSRNPLAKISIFESLAQVMVMVVLVCIVGLVSIYLVIRL
jgi:hypothetical protein